MRTQINITRDYIVKGMPGNCQTCPVALAIHDVIKSPNWVQVTAACIRIISGNDVLNIKTPAEAARFIQVYDRNWRQAKLCDFELDLPSNWLRDPLRRVQ